jgi:hypothetical protein
MFSMQPEQLHGHGLNAGRENAVNGAHGGQWSLYGEGKQTQTKLLVTCEPHSVRALGSPGLYSIHLFIGAHKIPPSRQPSKASHNHPLGNKTPFPNLNPAWQVLNTPLLWP